MSTLAQELKSEKRRKRERAAAESRRREREEASRGEEDSRRDTSTRPEKSTRADTGTGTVTRKSARLASSQPALNPPMISDQELSRNWTKVSETPTETVWTQRFRGGEREYRQKRYYRN